MSDVVNVFWSAIKMATDTSSRQREKKEHLIWHFFSKAQKEEINKIIQTFNQPKEYITCASKCAYYTPLIHHAPTPLELLTGNVHKTVLTSLLPWTVQLGKLKSWHLCVCYFNLPHNSFCNSIPHRQCPLSRTMHPTTLRKLFTTTTAQAIDPASKLLRCQCDPESTRSTREAPHCKPLDQKAQVPTSCWQTPQDTPRGPGVMSRQFRVVLATQRGSTQYLAAGLMLLLSSQATVMKRLKWLIQFSLTLPNTKITTCHF